MKRKGKYELKISPLKVRWQLNA